MRKIQKTIARAAAHGRSEFDRNLLELCLEMRDAINSHRYPEIPEIPEIPEFNTEQYIDPRTTSVYHVGTAWWMYHTVKEAIDAINAAPVAPSSNDRRMVLIWPGFYESHETVDVPGDVVVQGMSKRAATLYNPTSDMFRCVGERVYFFELCMRGSLNEDIFLIDCNGKSDVRLDRVDMVGTSGVNTQKFLKQSGNTWNTLIIENLVISSAATSGSMISLANTSGASRNVGVQMTNVRSDMWQLSAAGRFLDLLDCQDIDLRNCHIRGNGTHCTGVRFQRAGGSSGTPYMGVQTTRFTCAVALETTANTSVTLFNTYAKPISGAGSVTSYNSTTA
jgi:hypothetical protein